MSIIIPSIGNSISHGGILMKKDKMKSKNTDYSCDDYDDFFEDNIAETESDYDDLLLQLSFSRAKIMCYQGSKSPTQYKRRKQTWQKENYHQPKYTIALVWHFFLLCSVFPFCTRQGFLFLLRFFHLVCSML